MSIYNQARDMEPYIRELADNDDRYHISKKIETLTLKELRILKIVMDLGESGRGRLTVIEKDGNLKEDTFFKIEIKEKAEIILRRFSKLLIYTSRDRLLTKIATSYSLGAYLLNGLEVLSELKAIQGPSESEKEEWPELEINHKGHRNLANPVLVQIVETGIQQDTYKYFLIEDKIAENLESLKQQFITWIQEGEGLYPHRMVHRNIYNENIVFEGYVCNYDGYDFIDWVNAYVYESLVAVEAPIAEKKMSVSKVIVF